MGCGCLSRLLPVVSLFARFARCSTTYVHNRNHDGRARQP